MLTTMRLLLKKLILRMETMKKMHRRCLSIEMREIIESRMRRVFSTVDGERYGSQGLKLESE